jgi:hypothetical protein
MEPNISFPFFYNGSIKKSVQYEMVKRRSMYIYIDPREQLK